jgi:hypothetical protein
MGERTKASVVEVTSFSSGAIRHGQAIFVLADAKRARECAKECAPFLAAREATAAVDRLGAFWLAIIGSCQRIPSNAGRSALRLDNLWQIA